MASGLCVAEKITLFRGLFRGREDVFPTFWHNAKLDRSGYAPAREVTPSETRNKSADGIASSANRALLPVTDKVIENHLRGRHTIGVYPLLTDNTCWFLAADFDDTDWIDDTKAFVSIARGFGLSPSIERSRSGSGAHVWFFFSEPIPATIARSVGSLLISETIKHRHQVKLNSYDRLFPNQDTLPKGGFGNLIALPLERAAAERRNTLFLNDEWEPFDDQWSYLASLKRHSKSALETLCAANEGTRGILGIRTVQDFHNFDDEKDLHLPLFPRVAPLAFGAQAGPTEIHAVLAERLLISKAGLSSPLIAEIKALAAFQNPEFYEKQRLRLSTHATPRIISCGEESAEKISLPRGCLTGVKSLAAKFGAQLAIDDCRTEGLEIPIEFRGELAREQTLAVNALAAADIGVLVAPPGSGKTIMAIALLALRGRNALILVHRRPLLDQWVARLAVFTGRGPRDIGQITSGKRRITGSIDVATVQSLLRKDEVDEMVSSYGTVIVDECHHVAAVSFERVLSSVRARYLIGLTATPKRRDGLHPIVHMQLGPVRYAIKTATHGEIGPSRSVIVRETTFAPDVGDTSIQQVYAALSTAESRNDLIFDDILRSLDEGRSPIVLTERRDHLEYLAERLSRFARNVIVMHGGTGVRERTSIAQALAQIPADEERLILATGRYIGEGFDDARLDTLFLTMPVAWRGTLVQYAGRLQRAYSGKRDVRVYDYVDQAVPVLARMFDKRRRGYRAMGYRIDG